MTLLYFYGSLLFGDKMISQIILEDVLEEMVDNICYARLKAVVSVKKNSL